MRANLQRAGLQRAGLYAIAAGLMLAACLQHAAAWNAPVPDVVLYCTPAMTGALAQAAKRYTAHAHVEVHIFTAPPDGILGLLKHRARDDVVVADAATLQTLAEGRMVRPDTVVVLGQDPYVLVGKAGGAQPADATAAQLVTARRTVLPDPTTAASFDGGAVLRAALPGASPAGEIGVADTPTVIDTVRRNAGLLGLVQQTEAHGAGVAQVAVLNVPASVISGGLVTNGQSANAAALLAFLTGPEAQAALRKAGLEARR